MAETHAVPNAWYDLSGRLDAARAVAGATLDYLPCGDPVVPLMNQVNHLGHLIAAVNDLLDLAINDAERLECELKTGVPQ